MGACATKPKVLLYGGGANSKKPETEVDETPTPKKQQEVVRVEEGQDDGDFDYRLQVQEIRHDENEMAEGDDYSYKRPSLSLLFKQNEDGKVETEKQDSPEVLAEAKSSGENQANEIVEQLVRQGISETEKTSEDYIESNKQVKQEAPELTQQSSRENQGIQTAEQRVKEESSEQNPDNEAVKQKSTESSGENEGHEPAERQVKQEKSEAKAEAEKPLEGNHSNDAVKQESQEDKEKQESSEAEEEPTRDSEIIDTAKQEPFDSTGRRDEPSKNPSEAENVDNPVITEVIPPIELAFEKVIRVEVPATEIQKNDEPEES